MGYTTFAERQEMRGEGVTCPKCIFYGKKHKGSHFDQNQKSVRNKPSRKKVA